MDDWHTSSSGNQTFKLIKHTTTGAAISLQCRMSGVYVPASATRPPPGFNPRRVGVTKRFMPGRKHTKKPKE